ncbi:MAG TPA: hypothetical protein PLT91_07540 [Clostridia bacterium]|jgi:predicted membrane channel-forming protein YqfA (hemolysin III family)|nr:hypothetical protein [Clostridia bacterium]HQM40072.1 hypothetical protein [Clostridia bacterium]
MKKLYEYTVEEEVANTITHGVIASLVLLSISFAILYVNAKGSYTAIALTVIGGWQSIVIIYMQWTMVIVEILHNVLLETSVVVYHIISWTLLAFLPLFIKHASVSILVVVLLEGIFYFIGAIINSKKSFKYYLFYNKPVYMS